jgi:hypothetical protein
MWCIAEYSGFRVIQGYTGFRVWCIAENTLCMAPSNCAVEGHLTTMSFSATSVIVVEALGLWSRGPGVTS